MKTRALKFIDRTIGSPLCRLTKCPPKTAVPLRPRHILIIRPGGIGDAVLLIPAIRALQLLYPKTEIDILAEKRNAATFLLCPHIHRVFRYDTIRGIKVLFKQQYDIVIDSEQWHRMSTLFARSTGANTIIGFGSNNRRRMLTHPCSYSHDDYEVDSFLRLLRPLGGGVNTPVKRPFLSIPKEFNYIAQLTPHPLLHKKYIVIFPGASIAERRWGGKNFGELASRLHETGHEIVLIGGREDKEEGAVISARCPLTDLTGKTSLTASAALIRDAALLISGDSGILHIAVGLDVPTVSIFGPGLSKKWAPRGEKHIVINKKLPCSPCTRFGTTPRCGNDTACMRKISVREVFQAAYGLLNGHK